MFSAALRSPLFALVLVKVTETLQIIQVVSGNRVAMM